MAQEFHPNVDRFHLLTELFIMHGKKLCFDRADYEMNRNLHDPPKSLHPIYSTLENFVILQPVFLKNQLETCCG